MERSVMMKEELIETLLTKIKNTFYVIDNNKYPQSEDICSLNRDEIYVYLYDKEKGQDVGQWRKASDFIDIGRSKF